MDNRKVASNYLLMDQATLDIIMNRALSLDGWFKAEELHVVSGPRNVSSVLNKLVLDGDLERRRTKGRKVEFKWKRK